MKTKPDIDPRRWRLPLALIASLTLWSLAATAPDAAIRANLDDFGAVPWKTA